MNKLQSLLNSQAYIVLDGAMGTLLMEMGLEQGAPPEEWNVSHPERLHDVHRRYVDAGSDIILTNTFGGTSYRLKLHNLQDRVYELNKAAAENARFVADESERNVIVAGSMGPTGELMVPMGAMTFDGCKAAYAEQARGLTDGGADVLWIETLSDLAEVRAAIEGARSVSDLPVAATLSFDTNGRTMMGVTAEQVVEAFAPYNLIALGANCGNNLPDTMAAAQAMHQLAPDLPIIAKANAGIPRWVRGESLKYDGTPDVMAGYAHHVHQMGVQLIGGCCGSSPEHIRAMADALAGKIPVEQLVQPMQSEGETAVSPTDTQPPDRKRRRRRNR